jgi:hypothetical protein
MTTAADGTYAAARLRNNPEGKPIGHFTGRCMRCANSDLWDDETAYGCNACGAIYMTSTIPPRWITNGKQP